MSKKKSAAEQSIANAPRTRVGKGKSRAQPPTDEREVSAASSKRSPCEKCGEVHTKCNGHTRHGPNTGKPCGANPRRGQLVCVKHGGNHPAQIKSGKQRLLELVDPALAALHKVLADPNTEDAVKVRAALGILDRTGFRPGMDVTVHTSEWDAATDAMVRDMLAGNNGTLPVDRALDGGGGAQGELAAYNAIQLAEDARAEAWRESGYDAEDAPPDHPYRDENTVRGEVVDDNAGRYDTPPDRDPSEPPRYRDDEAREARARGD